jgi:outer membrane receptor protein involved in Fe transport
MLVLVVQAKAQGSATVSGRVIDRSTGEAVSYASVAVFSEEDELLTGNMTGEDGTFIISGLEEGTYRLVVSFVGYRDYDTRVLIGRLNRYYDLGVIELDTSPTRLDEVYVIGERPEIADDLHKKSYNINNNITAAGGSVLDAMKALPGITFDQEGKVMLRGSDKVIVLIDGKQSSLTGFGNQKGLDNIPAANVERIEIINNPSAKYDASGMAGVINIMYSKDQQYGLHGSAGFSYGMGVLTRPRADLPSDLGSYRYNPKYIPSLDLNVTNEKVHAFIQGEVLRQNRLPNNEFTTRYYDDGRITASQVPENRTQTHYIFRGGVDYQMDERNTLRVSGLYDWEKHRDTAQVLYMDQVNDEVLRYIAWNEDEITGHINAGLDYTHRFRQAGHALDARIQYAKEWEDETYYINELSEDRQGRDVTSILGTEHILSVMMDYVKPLRSGRLEGGAKIQLRDLPVEYSAEPDANTILYPGLGSWSNWGEDTYAGYLNWVHEKERYEVEAGLRAEYSSVLYEMDTANIYFEEDDAYEYFELFPNVRLSYKLNERNKFSVFYNRRIDRPGEPELRMYPKSDDHELVKIGNPYLRPQLTQSAEIAYRTEWKSGSLFISGYMRFTRDPYMRVYTEDETNTEYDIILKSYANTGQSASRGMELVLGQELLDAWKLSGSINFYQNHIDAYEGTLYFPYEHMFSVEKSTRNSWDFKLNSTWELPKEFQIQLTGIYFAPVNIPQGKQLSRGSIDLGIKKALWSGKLEMTLSASDILNTYGIRQEIRGDGFDVLYQNYYETQVISLGAKYKF